MKHNPATGEAISEAADWYFLKCRAHHTSQVMDNESMTVINSSRNMEGALPIQG
jgi:hypothetical protein